MTVKTRRHSKMTSNQNEFTMHANRLRTRKGMDMLDCEENFFAGAFVSFRLVSHSGMWYFQSFKQNSSHLLR
jgi:hypothetical protein